MARTVTKGTERIQGRLVEVEYSLDSYPVFTLGVALLSYLFGVLSVIGFIFFYVFLMFRLAK